MRSRLVPWIPRIGRGAGGRCKLGPVGDGGVFDLVVSWHDKGPDGARVPREYRRAVTGRDLGVKPCVVAMETLRHVLELRGIV